MPDTKREGPIAGEWSAGSPLLAAAFIGLMVSTGPLVIQSFGFFIIPLATEFDWSRGQVAGGAAIASIGLAVGGPLHGLAIDRLGPRLPILFSIVGLSAALASMYLLAPPIWRLYASFAAMTLLGSSASPIGYSRILIRTFDKHRGIALGVALAGVGTGTMLWPPQISQRNRGAPRFVGDSAGSDLSCGHINNPLIRKLWRWYDRVGQSTD